MNPIKISIPKPCHESWDAMTPDSKGRFCALCEKSVVDFIGMKAPEISEYFMVNSGKKVCGRFEDEQLHRSEAPLLPPALVNRIMQRPLNFRQMFVIALLVCMGSTLFSCNTSKGEPAFKEATAIGTTAVDTTAHSNLKIEPVNLADLMPDSIACTKSVSSSFIGFVVTERPLPVTEEMGEVAVMPKRENHLMGDTILPPPPPHVEETYKAPKGIEEEVRIKTDNE